MDFTVRSVLVCDDVRQEAHGKTTVLGLYDDAILVPAFPAAFQKLVVRFAVEVHSADPPRKIVSRIQGENGHIVAIADHPFPLDQVKQDQPPAGEPWHFALNFSLSPALFPAAGKYLVSLGFDEDSPRQVADFSVREPRNEQERNKLSN